MNIRLGIIGYGWMGKQLARAAAEQRDVTVAAIADPAVCAKSRSDGAGHSLLPGQLGARLYDDYTEMLTQEGLDGVIVATPESLHVDPVIRAAEAGCHVFLEKPIGRTLHEADQIIQACADSKRKLMIGYILRFEPAYVSIKKAIKNGNIGDVKSMYARRNAPIWEARRLNGRTSVTNYIAVHDIDQVLWYNEGIDVQSVYAKAIRGQVQDEFGTWDSSWAFIQFSNGSLAIVETGWGLPENAWIDSKMNVIGTKGQYALDFVPMNVMGVDQHGWTFPATRVWSEVEGRLVGALKNEIVHFIDSIAADSAPCITGAEGKRSLEVAIAIERSIEEEREVTLPL